MSDFSLPANGSAMLRLEMHLQRCAQPLIALLLCACGARTGPAPPLDGASAASDAGVDAGIEVVCTDLPTSDEPIVPPPTCEVAWASCRPVVTSAVIIPAACGQFPSAIWTGEAILVGYNSTDREGSGGAGLATVGLDGRLRRNVEVLPFQPNGQAVSLAWSGRTRRALLAGVHELAWLDERGAVIAGPTRHGAEGATAPVQVVAEASGFSLGRVDSGLWTAQIAEPSSPLPGWTRVDESVQAFGFIRDAQGLRRGIAMATAESTLVAPDEAVGRSVSRSGMRYLGGAVALANRFIVGEVPLDAGGFWVHDFSDDGGAATSTLVSNEPSPWGMDVLAMDAHPLVAAPFRADGLLRIGVYAVNELSAGPRFLVGGDGSPRQPALLRLPRGFAVVYFVGGAGIAVDVFDCCAP